MRSSLARYLRAALLWLLVLGATELLLRALDVKMAGSNYRADPLTGVGLRPGARSWATNEGVAWSDINSQGYRDLERSIEKPPGAFRIAVLGDSITEARQVEQGAVFTRLMETDLASCGALPGGKLEVLNFAVPGFGTSHEYLTLRERVWAYEPDMVVLVFYSGNDIFDNHRKLRGIDVEISPYFTLRDGKLQHDDSFRYARRYNRWYSVLKDTASDMLNSSVLALTVYETRLRLESLRVRRPTPQAEPAPAPVEKETVPPSGYARFWFYTEPKDPVFVEAWDVTEALLSAIAEETRAHQTPFLLIGIPTAEQLHPDEAVRAAIRAEHGLETLDYPEQRLAAWASREQVDFLDAGPQLRAYAVREQAYLNGFENTAMGAGHLNELGHQVASKLFSETICEMLTGH